MTNAPIVILRWFGGADDLFWQFVGVGIGALVAIAGICWLIYVLIRKWWGS